MSFDSSRFTFNPWNDFAGVVMQQGRVQLDSDWNEWLAEIARRTQAGTLDILGRAVVPATTPGAFQITLTTGSDGTPVLTIGPGRMYVDGLLAENHGLPAPPSSGWTPNGLTPTAAPSGLIWDPALAELTGSSPIPYTQQPYLPGAPAFPEEGGPFLVYLDVWHRSITLLEYPDLVEKAVGVDTTGRIQLVWQVKFLDLSQTNANLPVTCSTPDSDIPGWSSLLLPPGPLLTTGVVPSTQTGPCCLAPNNGYTGLENQLYRVEIHQTVSANGAPATFKWSRDNASVATGVTSIAQGGTSLIVQSIGKDDVLRFSKNDWVEITDDWLELNGLPGELHQVKDVTDASSTITLFSAVSSTSFPVDANGLTTPSRHTRLTRWDQKGIFYQADGTTVWADLTVAGATGDIPVPPSGTSLLLENGVTVSFDQLTGGAPAQPGQFWTFAARTADGTVEFLDQAPPRGVHHHLARLAVVTLPNTVSDCRTFWPPNTGATCCDCTVSIKPGDLQGDTTLQTIVDKYQNLATRTTFCFAAGAYTLTGPVRLTAAHTNFVFESCQKGAVTLQPSSDQIKNFIDGLFVLDGARQIAFQGLNFTLGLIPFAPSTFAGIPVGQLDPEIGTTIKNLVVSIGLRVVSVAGLIVEDCVFTFPDLQAAYKKNGVPFCVGIFANGHCKGFQIEGNTFTGTGVFSAGFLQAPWAQFLPPTPPPTPAPTPTPSPTPTPGLTPTPGPTPTNSQVFDASGALIQGAAAIKSKAKVSLLKSKATTAAVNTEVSDLPNVWLNNLLANGTIGAVDSSKGGSALPATLHDAILRDNVFSNLTVAALVLAKTEVVEFLTNEVDNCVAGLWVFSPMQTSFLLLNPEQVIIVSLMIAIGYPLPDAEAATLVTVPAAPAAARITANPQGFTDSTGKHWSPDTTAKIVTVSAGTVSTPVVLGAGTITGAQPGSTDTPLYQSERWAPDFSYTFIGLKPGFYSVTIKLVELLFAKQGERVFDVHINGLPVITGMDLELFFKTDVVSDLTFFGVRCTKDQIVVEFKDSNTGSDLHAKCSSMQVLPNWGTDEVSSQLAVAGTLNGSVPSQFLSFTLQMLALSQQGYALVPFVPMQMRVDDNEMRGLRVAGLLVAGDDTVEIGVTSSLMSSGNRMTRVPPPAGVVANPDAAGGFNIAQVHSTNFAGGSRAVAGLFGIVALVYAVNHCLVNDNTLINEGAPRGFGSLALGVAPQVTKPVIMTPVAQVMASGNVLRGLIGIFPPRGFYFPGFTLPPPMDGWEFLNTVILG